MHASTLASALETALNLYLRQDPDNLRRAKELQGRVVALEVTGLDIRFYLFGDADKITVLSQYEGPVDTRLLGSPMGFARLTLDNREDALFQGAVKVEGDTEVGRQLQALLAGTDWDWEEQLSRLTGDVVAHQAGRLAARLRQALDDTRETLTRDCGEYLQEEARVLPTRVEVDYFLAAVDRLRDDGERLQARVERLLRGVDTAS